MWVPMAILAAGSLVLGGILNYLGFISWLEPAIAGSGHEHGEPVLPVPVITGVTLIVITLGVVLAWVMYVKKPVPEAAPVGSWITQAARQDLYQDLVNDYAVVQPVMTVSRVTKVTDKHVVDGAVEGIAMLMQWLGKVASSFQNGYVRSYTSYMVIGLLAALITVAAVVL